MRKGVEMVVLLVIAFIFTGVCVYFASIPPWHGQTATEEWAFEKHFEDRGNGVYHVNGDIWQIQSHEFEKPPEPRDPTRLTTTEELATVIGQWRTHHPELRVISIVSMLNPPCLIIVTEPR